MCFPIDTFFSKPQLKKLHRNFCHPSADKLFKLLKRARPDETTPETLETLKKISKCCDPCKRIQNGLTRFRVSLGRENTRFNDEVMLDIMYIDGKPILHIVDDSTHFSAARYLPNVSTKTIWATIVECWASMYTGLPNAIRFDQGSQLGNFLISIGTISGIQVNRSGIETHNALGIGERYHHIITAQYVPQIEFDIPAMC